LESQDQKIISSVTLKKTQLDSKNILKIS